MLVDRDTRITLQGRYIELYKTHESNEVVSEMLGISEAEGLNILANKSVFSILASNGCYVNSEELFLTLDDKQQAFVNEYMVDFNCTEAAKRASYDAPGATGRRLLNTAAIRFIIMCRQLELRDISQVTSQAVLNELSRIAFADIGDFVEFDNSIVTLKDSSKVDTSMISEVQSTQYGVKIKLHNKSSALEMLGKHLGMFREKVEITGKDGGPIEISMNIEKLRGKFNDIIARAASQLSDDLNKTAQETMEENFELKPIEKENENGSKD